MQDGAEYDQLCYFQPLIALIGCFTCACSRQIKIRLNNFMYVPYE